MRSGSGHIHAAVLLFGLSGLFGKLIGQSPVIIVFGRTMVAFAALLVFAPAAGRAVSVPGRRELPVLIAQGMLLALHWAAFFQSIAVSSVAVGLLTFSSFPLFTVILEPVFFHGRLRWYDIITALMVIAGVSIVIPAFTLTDAITRGAVWGLFAGLSFALLTLVNAFALRRTAPYTIVMVQNGTAALFFLPALLWLKPVFTASDAGLLLALGVFCTAAAQVLYTTSLKELRPQTVSVIMALEPLYGIIFAFIFLGEVPGGRTAAGGVLIIAAVLIAAFRDAGRGRQSVPAA
ncbi:DMT family transporter [bacterium]|nr:DMT family transporter [bacterium]